jgi:hypothetical protein
MKGKVRSHWAWGVEWERSGKRQVVLDYSFPRTQREARQAFERSQGISWAKASEAGAKLVKRRWFSLPHA